MPKQQLTANHLTISCATPLNRNLDEANIFRFDVESYSLKYVKCQMIEMFTDEVSE